MDNKEFESFLLAKSDEMKDFVHRQLPIRIGAASKAFFHNNFRLQGFLAGSQQGFLLKD